MHIIFYLEKSQIPWHAIKFLVRHTDLPSLSQQNHFSIVDFEMDNLLGAPQFFQPISY